jgi:N,N'-diacetyllegionaminate synthase
MSGKENNRQPAQIGKGCPLFIIAEAANAHEGNFDWALELIRAAADAKADAIKFQRFKAERLITLNDPKLEHFKRLEFGDEQWSTLIKTAHEKGLFFFVDLFYENAVDEMYALGADGFKIHSTDISNPYMLRSLKGKNIPILLSAAGSTEDEIQNAITSLKGCSLILMHGFQGFPTDVRDLNLKRIATLKEIYGIPVGIQDHLAGDAPLCPVIPLIAMGMEIAIIEKHITLDRSLKGIDYYSSLNPNEFKNMVSMIRDAEIALGSGLMEMSENERIYRKKMKKFIVASKITKKGEIISEGSLDFKRVGDGISPALAEKICGKTLKRDLAADETLRLEDLELNAVAMIAVRMSSTRLPKKALIEIEGRTTIEHLIDRLKLAKVPKSVLLCTSTHPDDKVLLEIAEKNGIKTFAGSEDDVMDRFIKAGEIESADIVVRITGDDILIDPVHLDKAIFYHFENSADYTSMSGLPKGTECEIISFNALKKAHKLAIDSRWTEYMTYYLKVPEFFKVADMPVDAAYRRDFRLTLDYPEDLEVLKIIFKNLYRPGKVFSIEELIAFLDGNPDVLAINRDVKPKALPPEINTGLKIHGGISNA